MPILKVGIARGIAWDDIVPCFHAALDGGFGHLEITMNTPDAAGLIRLAAKEFADRALIGAGTVTTRDELERALDAGARFIVSPVTDIPIIEACVKRGIPVYPGALTPTEIFTAWKAGAAMVKVFPASAAGGPAYIRDIKAPLDRIKLMAVGGVTPENIADYIRAGVDGIALGNQLFNREWIAGREFSKITAHARRF